MPLIKNVKDLNERITLISVTSSGPDPSKKKETEVGTCWANVRTQYIKDIKDNVGTIYQDTVEIVIRQYQNFDITNKMLVKWQGQTYNIVKINPDTANKAFKVLFVKKVN